MGSLVYPNLKKAQRSTNMKSDVIGALASGLCAIHCLATPFIFVIQSCATTGCCESGPAWWSAIDYIFIVITLFAVIHSSKHSSKPWMKYALYGTWVILTLLVVNEKFSVVPLAAWCKYAAAISMISLHLYNLKYCQCAEDSCCIVTKT